MATIQQPRKLIKVLKYISITIAVVGAVIYLLSLLLRIDAVQHRLGERIANEIKDAYGIPVEIDRIRIRHLDEIILKGLLVKSYEGDTVVYAREGTAHISPLKIMKGEVQINTLRLAAPDIRINRNTPDAPLNIKFIIDRLGKRNDDNNRDVSLRINQFLVYDGKFRYDVFDRTAISGTVDKNHIMIDSLCCNISIRELSKEKADITIRSISGKEKSGITLKKFRVKAKTTKECCTLQNMEISLPGSTITSRNLTISKDTLSCGIPAFDGEIRSSGFSIADIRPFIGEHYRELPEIAFDITGSIDSRNAVTDINLATKSGSILLNATAGITSIYDRENRTCSINLKEGVVTQDGFGYLEQFIGRKDIAMIKKLGNINIEGNTHFTVSTFSGKTKITTQAGCIDANCFYDNGRYSIVAKGTGIQAGQITGIQELSNCNFETRISGDSRNWGNTVEVGGRITSLTACDYTYAPIDFTASVNKERIKAYIAADDPNLKGSMSLSYRPKMEERISLNLKVDSIEPYNLNLLNKPGNRFSFSINGNLHDYGKKKSLTTVKVDDFTILDDYSERKIRNIYICDDNSREQHMLLVNSDEIDCNIIGNFEYGTLLNSLNGIFARHLPGKNAIEGKLSGNNCMFKLDIRRTDILASIFNLPLTISEPSSVNGELNDGTGDMKLKAWMNGVTIAGSKCNTIEINGYGNREKIDMNLKAVMPVKSMNKGDGKDDSVFIGILSTFSNGSIASNVEWDSNHEKTIKGNLRFDADFMTKDDGKTYISGKLHPDKIIHNDSIWNISACDIFGNGDRLEINGLSLYNETQSLKVDGTAGKNENDTLGVEVKNLELGTIFSFIKFNALHFNGDATGKAYVTGIMNTPDAKGLFEINRFRINGSDMGTATIGIGWDSKSKSIILDSGINGNSGISMVKGFLSQANDTIELKINANNLNVGFLNRNLRGFISDLKGTGNGIVYLRGSWRDIDLYGAIGLDCTTRVNATNTTYTLANDTVWFSSGSILFNRTRVRDRYGNNGIMRGAVNHKFLSYWTCDLKFTIDKLLVYDTHDFGQMPFYGTVFASGTAGLVSNSEGLFLKANLANDPNSRIIYNSSEVGGVRDNSFVSFTDTSKKHYSKTDDSTEKNGFLSRLNLDFMLDVNDRLQLKVFTDLKTDSYIDLYGNGPIQAIYDEHEGFTMKGNLNLRRGTYKFTIQDVFPKEFSITQGSTLVFNGNPFNAALNLKTKYLVPSAYLSDLSAEVARRKSVKVNCLMDIGGTLQSPVLNFDLELPEGNEEEKEILASAINAPEQRNMQFIYLLGIGKFYTYDYNTPQESGTNSSTAMESFISNTLSNQLNNMLGHIIDSNNWDISGNFSTSEKGWNSMEVEGMLAGRLLNNRLLINGNFGYRENPIASSSFVGDFEVQWLMTPKGTFSLKAYSKTNDRYFSKTNLTTQGAGIILKHDFNSWRWWSKKKKKEGDSKEKEKEGKLQNGKMQMMK